MATSDRREYLTATMLDQATLDRMQDNCEFGLRMAADIESPDGWLHVSNGHTYVGTRFYQALAEFPTIRRTMGEWLNPALEFSTLELSIGNVDGRFNKYLPGGSHYDGWVGRSVTVRLGLRDVEATYFPIFQGEVTDAGGFRRDQKKITIVARDKFDKFSKEYPATAITREVFPDVEDNLIGTIIPVVYGDWTVALNPGGASIPGIPVNGRHDDVLEGTMNLQVLVSENANTYFDDAHCYVQRSDKFYHLDQANIVVGSGNRSFEIVQGGTATATVKDEETGMPVVETIVYTYEQGDKFWCRVRGKNLGSYSDNAVAIAKDILKTHGGATEDDFHSNWATVRDKAAPAESAIKNIKARVWRQEPVAAMAEASALLEEVRVEVFPDVNLQLKLSPFHFDAFPAPASISYTVRNWDLKRDTFSPKLDERNVWNRAKADYNFDPVLNATSQTTPTFRNDQAILQMKREISKKPVFPLLYRAEDVVLQLHEMLKVASSGSEFVDVVLTPRSVKKDLAEFIKINVRFGSTVMENVPAMIREIGYDPAGLAMPMKLWSFQLLPYPGYTPGYPGTYGGFSASITQEQGE